MCQDFFPCLLGVSEEEIKVGPSLAEEALEDWLPSECFPKEVLG